jgi:hypothetical protein
VFDWEEYLALAALLAADTGNEASLRTAISRAYYAAYHAAATYVRTEGLLRRRHTHQRVWNALAEGPDPERSDAGRRGDLLRRVRLDADYSNPFPEDLVKQARDAVPQARSIIELLRRLG